MVKDSDPDGGVPRIPGRSRYAVAGPFLKSIPQHTAITDPQYGAALPPASTFYGRVFAPPCRFLAG